MTTSELEGTDGSQRVERALAAFMARATAPWIHAREAAVVRAWIASACAEMDLLPFRAAPELIGETLARVANDTEDALPERHAGELVWTRACVAGHAEALASFTREFSPLIKAIGQRVKTVVEPDEFVQQVLERLLTRQAGQPARIGLYRGTGSLRGWVRVAASRYAIDLHRMVEPPREALEEQGPASEEMLPEIQIAIAKYAHRVRELLIQVLRELPPADRRLLRSHAIDGKTFDEIGAELGVHRTTASRRWEAARERVASEVLEAVTTEFRTSRSEARSLARALRSHVDLSVARLLSEGTDLVEE